MMQDNFDENEKYHMKVVSCCSWIKPERYYLNEIETQQIINDLKNGEVAIYCDRAASGSIMIDVGKVVAIIITSIHYGFKVFEHRFD